MPLVASIDRRVSPCQVWELFGHSSKLRGSSAMSTKSRDRLLVDRDKLMNAQRSKVADLCVTIFDRIQGAPKELQLLALAAAFILSSDASRIPAQDAFTATKNLMVAEETSSGLAPQFQAMKYHLATEVLS